MQKDKYLLLIVIVAYNSNDYIETCLESIDKFNDLGNDNVKTVVVDNSQVDNRINGEIIKKFKTVCFHFNDKNVGFGAANNVGAELFASDYILFLNPDTQLTESVFNQLIDQFQSDSKLGCMGIRQTGGGLSFFYRMEYDGSSKKLKEDNRLGRYNTDYCYFSGAFMFFSRTAFEKSGKFDKNLFLFCEEQDILRRLTNNNYKHKYDHTISFLHNIGQRKRMNKVLWEIGNESFIYYLKKHNLSIKKFSFQRVILLRKYQIRYLLLLKWKDLLIIQDIIKHLKIDMGIN